MPQKSQFHHAFTERHNRLFLSFDRAFFTTQFMESKMYRMSNELQNTDTIVSDIMNIQCRWSDCY